MNTDKRGQFFLMAALVIIAVLFSIGIIYNYARVQPEDKRVADLSKEFGYEGAKVIDSGIYQQKEQGAIKNYLTDLAVDYATSDSDSDFMAIYGDISSITSFKTNCIAAGSAIVGGGALEVCSGKNISTIENPQFVNINENEISFFFEDEQYKFNLREGQNFYIIVKKDKGGEKYVSKTNN